MRKNNGGDRGRRDVHDIVANEQSRKNFVIILAQFKRQPRGALFLRIAAHSHGAETGKRCFRRAEKRWQHDENQQCDDKPYDGIVHIKEKNSFRAKRDKNYVMIL